MIAYLVMIPVGYLLGALPFGYIIGWLFKRIDVRDYGSGKTGMTNVLRTVGLPAAALALLLDMGKATLAVVLTRVFFDSQGAEAGAAIAALMGHTWPVFAGFRGGRGTAPGWGALLILSPIAGLVASVVGLASVALSRYVSLGSILGTLSGIITLIALAVLGMVVEGASGAFWFASAEYIWFAVIGATLVIGLHRDNIQRLLKGEERKIGVSAQIES